jgi:hypothetical protein
LISFTIPFSANVKPDPKKGLDLDIDTLLCESDGCTPGRPAL